MTKKYMCKNCSMKIAKCDGCGAKFNKFDYICCVNTGEGTNKHYCQNCASTVYLEY